MTASKMNMTEVIKAVSLKSNITQKVCKQVIEAFEDVVIDNVTKGRRVIIRSFGAFYHRDRKQSVGRDVLNDGISPIEYGPRKQLAFRAIANFRDL